MALLAGLLFWAAGRNRATNPPGEGPGVDRARVAADLALLPGLEGPWWFDEIPWYLPFARHAAAGAVESAGDSAVLLGGNPAEYFDPNVAEVQDWLWGVVAQCCTGLSKPQQQLMRELKELADASLDDVKLAGRLDEALRQFIQTHAAGDWSAADLHVQALLLHKIAVLRSDAAAALNAKDAYDRAERQYAQNGNADGHLRLLCLSDAARLWADLLGDFKDAKRRFDDALAPAGLPALFRVEALAVWGADSASAGEYQDRLFDEARKVLKRSRSISPNHPLAAHVEERHAWSLMDQWKVDEAAKRFGDAANIRRANQREGNPYAAIYVFHDRHGRALTLRYRGKEDEAEGLYKSLVGNRILGDSSAEAGDIQTALEEAQRRPARPGQQRYLSDLRERWANSMERWADCELYGGAASGLPTNLTRAAQLYQASRVASSDYGVRVSMACKLSIVEALHGRKEQAVKVLTALDADPREIVGSDRERAGLLRQVAEAVLQLKQKGSADGRTSLRAFLQQAARTPTGPAARRWNCNYPARSCFSRPTWRARIRPPCKAISHAWTAPGYLSGSQRHAALSSPLLRAGNPGHGQRRPGPASPSTSWTAARPRRQRTLARAG